MNEPTPEPFTLQPLSTSSDPETGRRHRAHRGSSASSATQKAERRSASSDRGEHYSSSSESHGRMADTESNEKYEQHVELSPNVPQEPVKKKRTRTLTTPHQSRVLHALLAQSRFPSTAQREEVGRAIGLSARKVQIWFQNQRQKARRPKNPGTSPTAPSTSSSANLRSADSSLAGRKSPPHFGPDASSSQSNAQASELSFDYAESRRYLSGPGVPGPSLVTPLMAYKGPHEAGERRHSGSRTIGTSLRAHPYTPYERPHSLTPTIPFQSYAPAPPHGHYISRTLPPLIPSSPDSVGRGISRLSSFEASDPQPALSRPTLGIYRSHAFSTSPASTQTVTSPTIKPLVVPPRAEWISPPRSPMHPPLALNLDSHHTTTMLTHPAIFGDTSSTAIEDQAIERRLEEQNPAAQRSGRYDPVRGVVVPYPVTGETTSSSSNLPETDGGQ